MILKGGKFLISNINLLNYIKSSNETTLLLQKTILTELQKLTGVDYSKSLNAIDTEITSLKKI